MLQYDDNVVLQCVDVCRWMMMVVIMCDDVDIVYGCNDSAICNVCGCLCSYVLILSIVL